MQQHPDYNMGVPLKHINLAIEEPKPGDLAVTAARKAIRGLKIKRRTEFLNIGTIFKLNWAYTLMSDI